MNYTKGAQYKLSRKSIGLAIYLFLFFFLALYGNVFNKTLNQLVLWFGGPILAFWIVLPRIRSLSTLPSPYFLYASLLIFSGLSFFMVLDQGRFFRYYQVFFSNLVLMLIVFFAIRNEKEWFLQFEVLWLTAIVVVAFSYFSEVDTSVDFSDFRLSGLAGNANGVANYARVGILSGLVLWQKEGIGKLKSFTVSISIVFLAYIILITASRGAFFNLLLIIGGYFTWRYFKGMRAVLLFFIALTFGSALLAFFEEFIQGFYLYERLFRQGSFLATAEDDPRTLLYQKAFQLFAENPLFGLGLNQFRLYSGGLISHTDFLDIFVQLGLFAGLAYFAIYWKVGRKLLKLKKRYNQAKNEGLFIVLILFFISELLFGLTNPNWFTQLQMVILSLQITAVYKVFSIKRRKVIKFSNFTPSNAFEYPTT